MYETIALFFKIILTISIYIFIFGIAHLIYRDIKNLYKPASYDNTVPYLKLINLPDAFSFPVRDTYILDKDRMTIGRKNKNYIVIHDPYLSSEHLAISRQQNNYYIADLHSSNGTYLNGILLAADENVLLHNGDKLDIGQVSFLFVYNR